MANYHTEFSTKFYLNNEEEETWVKRHLGFPELLDRDGMVKPPKHYDANGPVSSEAKLWERCNQDLGSEDWEFDWDIRQDEGRKYVWFRSDESGSPYQVCCVVHAFLKAVRPEGEDIFMLTWADTCDKMRADAFGGGTMVSTKKGVGTCAHDEQFELARKSITEPWT